jgi:3-methyladenine DNA glycosylase Tag
LWGSRPDRSGPKPLAWIWIPWKEATVAGAPKQINPQRLGDYLDAMSKSVMQTGISWQVVDNKWPGIREAFDHFDAEKVAKYGEPELDRLVSDPRVIRNYKKLAAIVSNAQQMVHLEKEYGSFGKYLKSQGDFEDTVKDLRTRFKFLGDSGSYIFLYVVGEPVPSYDEWCHSRGRVHEHTHEHA